mmetsp:Transcript_6409/g.8813  ORF Transcript_6409/g.8813 Transcript_6409/m.8813 type:complete len:159 (-) Transcript_6409:151-627(-)
MFEGMMKGMQKQLQDFGAKPRDVPEAFFLFNLGLWSAYGGIFVMCSRFRPIRSFGGTAAGLVVRRRLAKIFGRRYFGFESYILRGAERFGQLGIVKPIPRMLGQAPQDFTLNLAETAAIYNVTFPFWFYAIGRALREHYHRKYGIPLSLLPADDKIKR